MTNDLNTIEGLSREVVRLETICRRQAAQLVELQTITDAVPDEETFENLRTLEALTKVDNLVRRVYAVLRLITRIRREAPELWEQILKFGRGV